LALFPPVVVNLLAGMSEMSWPVYLCFNLAGSVTYTITYMLMGYIFGKKWKSFVAWLGHPEFWLIAALAILIVCGVVFRKRLHGLCQSHSTNQT